MEYVPGLTLRDLIRKEAPMSPGKALAVIEPVLSALAAAHDAGILHRDVKPENVLLADDGRVKVADFGLARAINSDTQHTATGGVLIGTVSYLSPELVVNGKADARADVYAAGVLIYEMLTGHKPHQAESPIQVAYKHVHEDIPAPSASTRGIPPYVDALVARATARDPALRPADARVLLHQVRRVRHALDHGVTHDADLLADLTPTTPFGARGTPTGELPAQIIEPQEIAALTHEDVYDQERDVPGLLPPPHRQQPTPRPTPPPVRRHSRRGKVMLVVVLVLALLAALAGWYFGIARYTSTPGVLNLTEGAARVKLDQAGLGMKVEDHAFSETVSKGYVIDTDPDPGDRVLEDGTVGAVISLGPERHKVPDVRNKSLDDAQMALDDAKLAYGDAVNRYHEKIAEGRVITTDPAPGTALRRNTAVDVVVSKGPRPIRIPDFTGKPAGTRRDRPREPRVRGRHHRGEQRHRAPGAGHLAEPRLRHRPEGRRDLAGRLQGPGDGRGARRGPDGARGGTFAARGCRVPGRRTPVEPLHRRPVRRLDQPQGRHDGTEGQHRLRQRRLTPRRVPPVTFDTSVTLVTSIARATLRGRSGPRSGTAPRPSTDGGTLVTLPLHRLAGHLAGAVSLATVAVLLPSAAEATPWPGHPDRSIVRHTVRPGETATGPRRPLPRVDRRADPPEPPRLEGHPLPGAGAAHPGRRLRSPSRPRTGHPPPRTRQHRGAPAAPQAQAPPRTTT